MRRVDKIYSPPRAFAAVLKDGSVMTLGHKDDSGTSRSVQATLNDGVDIIYSTAGAFAAK